VRLRVALVGSVIMVCSGRWGAPRSQSTAGRCERHAGRVVVAWRCGAKRPAVAGRVTGAGPPRFVDRVTFNAHILETGTQSCRLRTTKTGTARSRTPG
jgi:hypothetical protein